MTDQTTLRRLAALTALASLVGAEVAAAKKQLGAAVVRGTVYVLADPDDPESTPLGRFSMSKPRQAKPKIIDETAAVEWVVDQFDADAALVEIRLSEQGRKSVLAAAELAASTGKELPAGVVIPAAGAPVASFTQDADAKAAVAELWRTGDLSLDDVLALDAGQEDAK